jgi:hypothetical protein
MNITDKPVIVICSHKKPQNQCRTCIMKTFLLCEHQIDAPWLTKDTRSVIFSYLPEEIVVPLLMFGEVYELKDGIVVTDPSNQRVENSVCGFESKRTGNPFIIYCSALATVQGHSGYSCCRKHAMRKSPSLGLSAIRNNKLISLKGMKYRMEEPKKSPF